MQWSGLGVVVVWGMVVGMPLAVAQPPSSPGEAVSGGATPFVGTVARAMGRGPRRGANRGRPSRPRPADLTRIAQRRGGHFPVAEITPAYIDPVGVASGRMAVGEMRSLGRTLWGDAGGRRPRRGRDPGYLRWLVEYLQTIQQ